MTTQTAIILARGLGTRMREARDVALRPDQQVAARRGAKAMMPFGRPFLDYSLSNLADAGITDAVLVIGPEHSSIQEYFQESAAGRRVKIRFAIQEAPLGTADAVRAARHQVQDESFLVLNGDNLYPTDAIRSLRELERDGLVAFTASALIEGAGLSPARLLKFALLNIDGASDLIDIHEKPAPDHPLATASVRYVSMNLWKFSPTIFLACDEVGRSIRGELELQDAVRHDMRAHLTRYHCVISNDAVIDLSSQEDIGEVAKHLSSLHPAP